MSFKNILIHKFNSLIIRVIILLEIQRNAIKRIKFDLKGLLVDRVANESRICSLPLQVQHRFYLEINMAWTRLSFFLPFLADTMVSRLKILRAIGPRGQLLIGIFLFFSAR